MDEVISPESDSSTSTPNQRGLLWLALTGESQAALQEACPPRYSTKFYDHVTLLFGVPRAEVAPLLNDRIHTVTAYALAHSQEVEAVRVQSEPGDPLPDQLGVPHVTLSTAPGVEPFRSVAMLQDEDHTEEPLPKPLKLRGTIKFIPFDEQAA